jgi:uncharacterized NAD(P)/FAD-binding protein YdhS
LEETVVQPTAIAAGASIAIVGGGLSGALCALHINAARPDLQLRIVERSERLGPGIAYGACSSGHLLNVPVSRLDIGISVSFETWLARHAHLYPDLAEALAESGGRLEDAFVPRRLFGAYVEQQIGELIASERLVWKRGEAIAFLDQPKRGVLLADGREIAADAVILALGNLPPKSPGPGESGLEDRGGFVPDPWANAALSNIQPSEAILLVGAGLTMVDVVLALKAQGHSGDMVATSRRGLLPARHAFGGHWPPFLASLLPMSPAALLRTVRRETDRARREGVPWQRVIDAIRPFVAHIWRSWNRRERRSFLRHLRPRWDVVRHRMAPRIADVIDALVAEGQLKIVPGRLAGCKQAGRDIAIDVAGSGDRQQTVHARHVINCTGPRSDFSSVGMPLIVDARRRKLIQPDPLGLGIETENCAVLSADGAPSSWLFAVGPLTRPAWWEITAAPEINAQVLDLAASLTAAPQETSSLADRFQDLGAGI